MIEKSWFQGGRDMEERKTNNRKRCLNCSDYGHNVCPLFADANTFDLDKCVKEYDFYKNIKENSIEKFIFETQPIMLLQYVSKSRPLNVGDIVITLTGGFGTFHSGKILKVFDVDDYQFTLIDRDNMKYCVQKETWYYKVFKLDSQTFERYQ